MEVSSSLQQHHLGDSFSDGWLNQAPPTSSFAADAGCSFVDVDDADLFSMRWTTTTPGDFDFGLPPLPGSPSCASRDFRRGRLLPAEPSAAQEQGYFVGVLPGTPTPWTSAASSSPSSCSGATSRHATMRGEKRGVSSSSWKVGVLRYVRFLMPLYRKARALAAAPRHNNNNRVAPAAASPGRGSTSESVHWCHGSADTAVHDAILYCKKSSGRDAHP